MTLQTGRLHIEMNTAGLVGATVSAEHPRPSFDRPNSVFCIEVPIALRRRGVERRIVVEAEGVAPAPDPDPALVTLIAKAHRYLNRLTSDEEISASRLAADEKIDISDLSRILRLAFLAPDITKAILDGQQPVGLTARKLMRMADIPHQWDDQRQALGF